MSRVGVWIRNPLAINQFFLPPVEYLKHLKFDSEREIAHTLTVEEKKKPKSLFLRWFHLHNIQHLLLGHIVARDLSNGSNTSRSATTWKKASPLRIFL